MRKTFLLLLLLYFATSAWGQGDTLHIFVVDRQQREDLGGKTQANERFRLAWHYWSDVDLIEDHLGKGLPSDQAQAMNVLQQRINAMTASDKAALGAAWRSRHMASDLGIAPDDMPAVWSDGRVITHVEDLRHVFSRFQ
jgi:cell division protein FtsB